MQQYQKILVSYLEKAKLKNHRISIRSTAGFLGISPSHLSALIRGKGDIPNLVES